VIHGCNRIEDYLASTPMQCACSHTRRSVPPIMEAEIKTTLITLLLLSLALAGCIIAPGPGPGYGERGYGHGGSGEFHADRGGWDR
jgi:hypothetical protein